MCFQCGPVGWVDILAGTVRASLSKELFVNENVDKCFQWKIFHDRLLKIQSTANAKNQIPAYLS